MPLIWLLVAPYWVVVGKVSAFQPLPSLLFPPGTTTTTCRSSRSAQQHTIINTNENAPRNIQTMEEWASACGVQRAEGFQLTTASSEDTDMLIPNGLHTGLDVNDVFATTSLDMPANSPVLFIPNEMILSSHRAVAELRSKDMEAAEQRIQSSHAPNDQLRQYYLMLKILLEYERGDASPWFPWLDALPRYFSNAVSMTPFCYKCLPTLMASLAKKERANLNHLQVRQVPFLTEDTKTNEGLWTWGLPNRLHAEL